MIFLIYLLGLAGTRLVAQFGYDYFNPVSLVFHAILIFLMWRIINLSSIQIEYREPMIIKPVSICAYHHGQMIISHISTIR